MGKKRANQPGYIQAKGKDGRTIWVPEQKQPNIKQTVRKQKSLETRLNEQTYILENELDDMNLEDLYDIQDLFKKNRKEYLFANKERIYQGEKRLQSAGYAGIIPPRYTTFDSEAYDEIKAEIDRLGKQIEMVRSKIYEQDPLPEYVSGFPGIGLHDAAIKVLDSINRLGDGNNISENIETCYWETMERLQAEEPIDFHSDENYMLILQEDTLISDATYEDFSGYMSYNKAVILTRFTDEFLTPVLNQIGVSNVSVSPLINGREKGLIYTVIQPDGKSRSFSIYEHRNRDSLIINGKENWDAEQEPHGPYAEDSKYKFFAEFSSGNFKTAASTLGYFLKQASSGTLESDEELVEKAEHLDWNAIIAKQIPAFKEWAEEQGMSINDDDRFLE